MALLESWDNHNPYSSHAATPGSVMNDVILETGFVGLTNDTRVPMFTLEKVEYRPRDLRVLVVSSNMLCMGLKNSHVIRLHLSHPQDLEGIPTSN